MDRPWTIEEFLSLIDQATFEMEDLVVSVGDEGDEDDLGRCLMVYEQLVRELKALQRAVQGGRHRFKNGSDLDLFVLAGKCKGQIPIYGLLEKINAAHRRGFE